MTNTKQVPYSTGLEIVMSDDGSYLLIDPHSQFLIGQAEYVLEQGGEPDEWITAPTKANAQLWVAAPELLEALQGAVAYLEEHRPKGKINDIFHELNEYENSVMKPARAAIAKATGQEVGQA